MSMLKTNKRRLSVLLTLVAYCLSNEKALAESDISKCSTIVICRMVLAILANSNKVNK